MLTLYDMRRSGNAYKARLLLSLLAIPHRVITVNLAAKEQMRPDYLAINPLHTVPVVDDDGTIIRDSAAVLVYLATKFDAHRNWYPADAAGAAKVQQWLAYANNEILNTLAAARAIGNGMRQGDLAEAQKKSRGVLSFVESQLAGKSYLETGSPTIADIACYPYCAMIGEGGIELSGYPAISSWCRRIESLKGYVALPPRPMPPDWQ